MRALVAAVLVLAAGEARAEVKREVPIESEPPGAEVYLNSKDEGSICTTPCTIKAPVGESVLIVELAGHVSKMERLVVPKRGKPAAVKLKLLRALGTVTVKGPAGAAIRIDGEDMGKAPASLEVEAGPHTVALAVAGKQVLQELIEVVQNDEVVVRSPDATASTEPPADPDPPVEGGVGDRAAPARAARGPIVAVSAIFDFGFRDFRYDNGVSETPTGVAANEGGVITGGPMIELWPGALLGRPLLRGFSLMGRLQFPINRQAINGETAGLMGNNKSVWQSLEISARHRWTIAKRGTIEASTGFVRDQYDYEDITEPTDRDLLPIATYASIRIGVRGSLLFPVSVGLIEPYLTGENRIVLTGGSTIEDRFTRSADVSSGLRGTAGVRATRGRFGAQIEGSLTRYAWTFKFESNDDRFRADGAVDLNKSISAALTFAY